MNGYLLPRCRTVGDALGAEQYTARAGFKLRSHLIIRPGSLADLIPQSRALATPLVTEYWADVSPPESPRQALRPLTARLFPKKAVLSARLGELPSVAVAELW